MEKFVIKNADGSEQNVIPAVHNSHKSAREAILNYMKDNIALMGDKIHFNFIIESVPLEPNKYITDFKSAQDIIGSSKFILAEDSFWFKDIELNMTHCEALIALNKLFTIAEAWNKEDEFVPDFSDCEQSKWTPWFKYDKDAAMFVYKSVTNAPAYMCTNFGPRLCFKTSKRAEQFGKKFTYLYNKVFCL